MNESEQLANRGNIYADGYQAVLAPEDDGVLLVQLAMRAGITVDQVISVLREMEELMPQKRNHHPESEAMDRFILRFVRPLISLKDLRTDCLLYANGFGHLIGCEKQTDIVTRHGGAKVAKANVNKYVKRFQHGLGLGRTAGQRSADGCQAMREARMNQLETASS